MKIKRLFTVILCGIILFSLAACNQKNEDYKSKLISIEQVPFVLYVYFITPLPILKIILWRTGWDSNPCTTFMIYLISNQTS